MPKTKISEFSSTPANNTDIDSINISEGCAPSGINDAIRELMAQLKDFQTGAVGDSFNGPVGTTTAAAGAFTTLSASGAVTLSGGTANGVAYLNGSKVVTSGSALTFDGTNLGLGVSPNANWATYNVLQIGEQGVISGFASGAGVLNTGANFYWDGSGYRYLTSNPASLYQQNAGGHNWRIASSGTAGNAITFTQAMTLDASGRLGIGTTSPDSKLVVEGSSGTYVQVKDGTVNTFIQARSADSSGVVGTLTNHALAFYTNSTEKARIDSSGRFMVATTSAGGTISCARNGGTYNYYATSDANNTTEGFFLGYSSGAGANRIIIYSNGNVVNANNSYGALSDSKLKENIVDATPKLAGLMQVKVRNYNLIGESTKQLGVVAQELETVFPAMVDESPDRDAEGNDLGTTTKSVKYSVFVPMLIKAMQEQQAIIESLKARLDAANL